MVNEICRGDYMVGICPCSKFYPILTWNFSDIGAVKSRQFRPLMTMRWVWRLACKCLIKAIECISTRRALDRGA